eukprot:g4582.t1
MVEIRGTDKLKFVKGWARMVDDHGNWLLEKDRRRVWTIFAQSVMARQFLSPSVLARSLDSPARHSLAAPGLALRPAQGVTTDGRSLRHTATFAASCVAATAACSSRRDRRERAVRHVAMAAEQTIEANPYLKSKVEEMVALQPVIVFSKSWCPFCAKAKEGIRFAVCELDTLGEEVEAQVQDILLGLTGARTVPRVFIGGQCIGGGTDTERLAGEGTLKKLAGEAMENFKTKLSGKATFEMDKSDEEWRSTLDPERFQILRRRGGTRKEFQLANSPPCPPFARWLFSKGTEMPGSHEYDKFLPKAGHFSCGGCGLPLYSAGSKFASQCGWPVFDKCYSSKDLGQHVLGQPDGTGSLEIVCARCGSHLGHVFYDAISEANPNGERH